MAQPKRSSPREQRPPTPQTVVGVENDADNAVENKRAEQEQATQDQPKTAAPMQPLAPLQHGLHGQPAAPLLVTDGGKCGGGLVVCTFGCIDDTDGLNAIPACDEPLAGVTVTVTGQGFSDTRATDKLGKVRWANLTEGEYTIYLSVPSGYQVPAVTITSEPNSLPQTVSTVTVAVKVEEETEVRANFTAADVEFLVGFFCDANGSGNPAGQAIIKDLTAYVYQGEEQIDCLHPSDACGIIRWKGKSRGLLALVAPQMITANGCRWRAAFGSRVLFQPAALPTAGMPANGEPVDGSCNTDCVTYLAYVMSQAEIRVEACFVPQPGTSLPLPGVTFTLHRGTTPGGAALQRQTTGYGHRAITFSDLDAATYTIVATWPKHYQGQTLEPSPSGSQIQQVGVTAGQVFGPLRFCFKPCRARVYGRVIDDDCGAGMAEVGLLLTAADGQLEPQAFMTGATGEFDVAVAAGDYILSLAQDKVHRDGKAWVIREGSQAERRITVGASGVVRAPEFRLIEEIHKVSGLVLTPDDEPVPHALVDIFNEAHKLVSSVPADAKGYYEYTVPYPGHYHLAVRQEHGHTATLVAVFVNPPVQQNLYTPGNSRAPQSIAVAANSAFKESVGDVTAYPLLTEEVSAVSAPRTGSSSGGTSSLGQIVDGALREVLSWRPKGGDVKGFLAALNQSFAINEVDGHTEWKWTPRSYAVQLDMGAITGAQASIYTRAKAALDQSLPLLEGLYPLLPDADAEDMEASRAIVTSNLTELVSELGMEGGPRVQRVDALFESLLGVNPIANPASVGGQLALLRTEFGLTTDRVNTIEEEQNLTNFFVLVDHAISLKLSWDAQRTFFDRVGPEVFLGTQLVLVSRVLAVVVESVYELEFIMDSVFLGAAERQTVRLEYPAAPSLTLGELLRWVHHVADNEGTRLIRDGGKAGIIALYPTVKKLLGLVSGAQIPPQDPSRLPAGYRTTRVQRALGELKGHLRELNDLIIVFVPLNQR